MRVRERASSPIPAQKNLSFFLKLWALLISEKGKTLKMNIYQKYSSRSVWRAITPLLQRMMKNSALYFLIQIPEKKLAECLQLDSTIFPFVKSKSAKLLSAQLFCNRLIIIITIIIVDLSSVKTTVTMLAFYLSFFTLYQGEIQSHSL